MDALNFFGTSLHFGQTSDVIIWVAFISAASAIASAALVGYVNYQLGRKLEQQRFKNNDLLEKQRIEHALQLEKQRIENADHQRQQLAFSRLMGQKFKIIQSYRSHFEEFIQSEYFNYLSKVNSIRYIDYTEILKMNQEDVSREFNKLANQYREQSIEFKTSETSDRRSRELSLLVGESSERLWMTMGLVQVLFSNKQELKDLIKKIQETEKEFQEFEMNMNNKNQDIYSTIQAEMGKIRSNAERDAWRKRHGIDSYSLMIANHGNFLKIQKNFEMHMDNLLNYLLAELETANDHDSEPLPPSIP